MDENPQLENGYVRIANPIMRALAAYRLSGEERKILDVIFMKTYGFNKKDDDISISQFYELTGMKKPSIVRAIKKLIEKNVVSKKANGTIPTYSFNKLFNTWKPLAKKLTVSNIANLSLAKKLPTIDTPTKDNNLSKDKLVKTSKRKEKDEGVEFVLSLYEKHTGTLPTDKFPRRVAHNIVQITTTLIKDIRPHYDSARIGELTHELILTKAFDWYFGQLKDDVEVTKLETVKQNIRARFYEGTRRKYVPNYKFIPKS